MKVRFTRVSDILRLLVIAGGDGMSSTLIIIRLSICQAASPTGGGPDKAPHTYIHIIK